MNNILATILSWFIATTHLPLVPEVKAEQENKGPTQTVSPMVRPRANGSYKVSPLTRALKS